MYVQVQVLYSRSITNHNLSIEVDTIGIKVSMQLLQNSIQKN